MPMAYKFTTGVAKMGVNSWPETVTRQRHRCDLNRGPTTCKPVGYRVYGVACDREKKDLKARQAKHSMESVKSVMSDKTVKNKAERDRCVLSVSYAHTHPCNGPFTRTTQVSWHQKSETNLDLLKQETVSGCGINWAVCKSAPRSRQITMPAPHHSVFTGRVPFLLPNQQHQSRFISQSVDQEMFRVA